MLGYKIPPEDKKVPRIPRSFIAFVIRPVRAPPSECKDTLLRDQIDAEHTGLEIHARIDPGISMRLLKGIIPWVVKNVRTKIRMSDTETLDGH